jgi:nitrogen fixation/metabolism regulation signal transduction histidine kinase
VSLRKKFVLYLLAVHLVFAAALVPLLKDERIWFLAVELFFLVSFVLALRLFRGLFRPLELIGSSVDYLRDADFTTRLHESGQPEMDRLIGVYNRMADHLRAERISLEEQHFFLDKLLTVSPSAVLSLDFDGKISFVNPAAASLLQADAADLLGKRMAELALPIAPTLEALPEGGSAVLPLRGIRRVMCRKTSFVDRGHPRTFYLFEELTEELRRAEKAAYEKLIRTLSHEVNNSLGAAGSLLQSCLRYADHLHESDRADFRQAISVAITRADHLNAFMRGFADVVKLPPPRRRWMDVRTPLRRIGTLLEAELRKGRIALAWELGNAPLEASIDEQQMEQAFLNILKNAMEAIGEEGTITVRAGEERGRSYLEIEDTGRGISDEARAHLFSPFFSTKENGQGIGLTLVQEILTHHQFEFALEGVPGKGTRFTIRFS